MYSVYVEHRPRASYSYESPFHPNQNYPEYPWGESCLAKTSNDAYDMVRDCLRQLGLDQENFGTEVWNPFGTFIAPGMTVLVKPNMVLNWHPEGSDPNLDTMITNPSLVRAVVDYVLIALRGSGTVIVGDAPLQSCDFEKLIVQTGYEGMRDFYASKGIPLRYVDFRQVRSKYNDDGILETSDAAGDPLGYLLVDMGEQSSHRDVRQHRGNFRVTNYDHRKMRNYHTSDNDSYLISGTALSADVIITMPKLKTHRKAGMTGSLKNFIGIIGHKDCLPHHRKGSQQEGGDEYLRPNSYKRLAVFLEEWFNIFSIANVHWAARQIRKGISFAWARAHQKNTDSYSEGSWYGNDTIWRTTLDLVRIARYSDKQGRLQAVPQRTIFGVADAIVAGEKEGPLIASRKEAGVVAVGFDLPALDLTLAALMGFDHRSLPTVRESFASTPLPLTSLAADSVFINSNHSVWHSQPAASLSRWLSLMFTPSAGWVGHVEREDFPCNSEKTPVNINGSELLSPD